MQLQPRCFFRGFALLTIPLTVWSSGCRPADGPTEISKSGPLQEYEVEKVIEVAGRQGVATDGTDYFISGSTALYVYSKDGELLRSNEEPFLDLARPANHIGDIAVHNGELFAGVEWFDDGQGHDIQVAVYDTNDLSYLRSIDWNPESGQVEVSAVTVDPHRSLLYLTDWVNGSHVYRYDLGTGEYQGKLRLNPVPQRQQGIAYRGGFLYITADDGEADLEEADNLWRVEAEPAASSAFVSHELELLDLRRAGEVEGVAWDELADELLVLSNRGARIVRGMPSGFYPGYDREVHEVYVFRARESPADR